MKTRRVQRISSITRRDFLKVAVSTTALGSIGLFKMEAAAHEEGNPFTFAYVSDSHLYERKVNERFIRSLEKGISDMNSLDPQPDFILYGGDLAQLGLPGELELGNQILSQLKAPVKMMVGEHDWYFDMGKKWRELFGKDIYSFSKEVGLYGGASVEGAWVRNREAFNAEYYGAKATPKAILMERKFSNPGADMLRAVLGSQ